jgi:hypothetical protein
MQTGERARERLTGGGLDQPRDAGRGLVCRAARRDEPDRPQPPRPPKRRHRHASVIGPAPLARRPVAKR